MSGERDRFVDLLRGASIVLVVVGHWLVADMTWTDGRLVETSALAEAPSLWPLSWLVAVIPVFFFVGGFSNARSWAGTRRRAEGYAAFVDRRVHRALVPMLAYVAVVTVVGLVVDAAGGLGVREGAGMLLQPLWFLGIYLLVVALTPVTLAWHRRAGWAVPGALLAVVLGCDVARFAVGVDAAGYVNVLVVWVLVHQLGYLYADGRIGRRAARWMAGAGLIGTLLLTGLDVFPYPQPMVGVPGGETGNMHPPTLAATALGVAAVGAAVLARPALVRWLDRPRVWRSVVGLNLSIMTLYLWHQAAAVLAARLVLPLGYPSPEPGTGAWWATRLLWLVVPGAVLVGLVALAGRFERVPAPPPAPDTVLTRRAAVIGVVVLGLGILALAGSDITRPAHTRPGLGPVVVTPLMGIALSAVAALVFAALRHGDRAARTALRGSAALLALTATAYAVGLGPLPIEPAVAWTLLWVAAGAGAGAVGGRGGRGGRRSPGAAVGPGAAGGGR